MEAEQPKRKKVSYVGVPAIFKLELACQHINTAFDGFGCYMVGSALERPDWRDVDIVYIMEDDAFSREFPDVVMPGFESDPKWLLNSIALSMWLTEQGGVPVDFKIQTQTWANERHMGPRHPMGKRIVP